MMLQGANWPNRVRKNEREWRASGWLPIPSHSSNKHCAPTLSQYHKFQVPSSKWTKLTTTNIKPISDTLRPALSLFTCESKAKTRENRRVRAEARARPDLIGPPVFNCHFIVSLDDPLKAHLDSALPSTQLKLQLPPTGRLGWWNAVEFNKSGPRCSLLVEWKLKRNLSESHRRTSGATVAFPNLTSLPLDQFQSAYSCWLPFSESLQSFNLAGA